MAGIVFGCVVPHPPVLLPEVGHDMAREVQPTVEALQQLGRHIASYEPETLVLMSPHGPLFSDRMAIGLAPKAEGNFANFNAPQVELAVNCDWELASAIQAVCARVAIDVTAVDVLTGGRDDGGTYWLDHGAAVPLHFLLPLVGNVRVVLLGFSYLPRATHVVFGERIREACEATGRRVAFVASGDLSHRLIPGAPAGYDPEGRFFDDAVVAALRIADWNAIVNLSPDLVERAGVCGYLSILALAGTMGKQTSRSEVLSYQGPFGVGYVVAEFEPMEGIGVRGQGLGAGDGGPGFGHQGPEDALGNRRPRMGDDEQLGARHSALSAPFTFPEAAFGEQIVALARAALEAYVAHGRRLALTPELPAAWQQKSSCFVTLRKDGELRGCVGTILPIQPSLAHEVIDNAIGAASRDYRFTPVRSHELPDLKFSVDVLTKPEPVTSADMLDPARYGMVVMQGSKVGVLLPGLDQITTVDQQFEICCLKAGITSRENIGIHRFEVARYAEPGAEH